MSCRDVLLTSDFVQVSRVSLLVKLQALLHESKELRVINVLFRHMVEHIGSLLNRDVCGATLPYFVYV